MIIYSKKDGINHIHDYNRRIKRYLENLNKIDSTNAKKIIEFHRELSLNGLSLATQTKYLDKLSNIIKWVKKDFSELTKNDIIDFMTENVTNNLSYSENTKAIHRIIFKRFFQWLKGYDNGDYPNKECEWCKGR